MVELIDDSPHCILVELHAASVLRNLQQGAAQPLLQCIRETEESRPIRAPNDVYDTEGFGRIGEGAHSITANDICQGLQIRHQIFVRDSVDFKQEAPVVRPFDMLEFASVDVFQNSLDSIRIIVAYELDLLLTVLLRHKLAPT